MGGTMNAMIWAGSLLAITGIICFASLRAWREWLDVRQQEIAVSRRGDESDSSSGVRIEVANLKERMRKLEAIARGVDL